MMNPVVLQIGGGLTGVLEALMPLFILLMFLYVFIKPIAQWKKKRDKNKKVEKTRSEEDRLYLGMKRASKKQDLLQHTPVKTTGDESTPPTKIGETVTGILPGNDEIIMFIRSKWWKLWEKPVCLRVAPELVGDFNAGEIKIKGKSLDPATDKFMYIVPPSQYHDNIEIEKVHKRRSRVASLKFKRLLNHDIDEDRSHVVKQAMRGSSKKAMKEIYMPNEPPKEKKEKLEREKRRKSKEMQREYEEDSGQGQQPPSMMQGGV